MSRDNSVDKYGAPTIRKNCTSLFLNDYQVLFMGDDVGLKRINNTDFYYGTMQDS